MSHSCFDVLSSSCPKPQTDMVSHTHMHTHTHTHTHTKLHIELKQRVIRTLVKSAPSACKYGQYTPLAISLGSSHEFNHQFSFSNIDETTRISQFTLVVCSNQCFEQAAKIMSDILLYIFFCPEEK